MKTKRTAAALIISLAPFALLSEAAIPSGNAKASAGKDRPPFVASKFEVFVVDPERSTTFYTALGFTVVSRHADGYTTFRSGDVVLAISPAKREHPEEFLASMRLPPIGVEIVLYTDRLAELHSVVEKAELNPDPLKLQPWGLRDFRVRDPDGYYIRITEGRAL